MYISTQYSRCVFTRHSMYPKINKAMKHAKMCVKWEERPKSKNNNNNNNSVHYVLEMYINTHSDTNILASMYTHVWSVVCASLLVWNWISNRLAYIELYGGTHTLTKPKYKHKFAATPVRHGTAQRRCQDGWMCVRAAHTLHTVYVTHRLVCACVRLFQCEYVVVIYSESVLCIAYIVKRVVGCLTEQRAYWMCFQLCMLWLRLYLYLHLCACVCLYGAPFARLKWMKETKWIWMSLVDHSKHFERQCLYQQEEKNTHWNIIIYLSLFVRGLCFCFHFAFSSIFMYASYICCCCCLLSS